jgi:hypothetical protein
MRTIEELNNLVKELYRDGDFTLNPEKSEEFVGCRVDLVCPHADIKVDRVVWYHFARAKDGESFCFKSCPACTILAMAHPDYAKMGIACRESKVMVSTDAMKDMMRSGLMGVAISDLGRKLEQEVLEESREKGIN